MLAAALGVGACTYAGKSRTYVDLLGRPDPSAVREGLDGIIDSNGQAIRRIAGRRDPERGPWLRFVVIGDTLSDNNRAYREMLAAVSALEPVPVFIVNLGDFVANRLENCSFYLDAIKGYPHPIIHVRGNHEAHGGVRRVVEAVFGERDFFFDLEDVRFIFMGSDELGMTGPRLAWLEDRLRGPGPSKKLFFTHEFPVGAFEGSFRGVYALFARRQRNEARMLELLERYRVPLAFFGHWHRHHQTLHEGTVMVVSGGGGQRNYLEPRARQPLATKENHFTLIDLMAEKGRPVQGVITCVSRDRVPLFMTSFNELGAPAEASGADGRNGRGRMSLQPYDPFDAALVHPPYIAPILEAYAKKGRLLSGPRRP